MNDKNMKKHPLRWALLAAVALYGEMRKELEALDGSADTGWAIHLIDVLEQ